MTAKQIIEMAMAYGRITSSEMSRRLGWSPQVFSGRMKTGKFSVEEWNKIAEAMGAEVKIGFVFPDGKEVF